jgi:predicted nucleic acid-binding protein
MVYLDANVFVFAALATDDLGNASRRILEGLRGINAKTCCLTIDELAWAALRRVDTLTTVKICRAVLALEDLDIVSVEFGDMWKMADIMGRFGLRPRDAVHLAVMNRLNEKVIVTEDTHFNVAGVKRFPIEMFARSI